MPKLLLLRHLKSEWNKEDRFAGWTDGALDKKEAEGARNLATKLSAFQIDKIYSSALFRNQDTIARILENIDDKYAFFIHLDKGKMREWGNYHDISDRDIPVFVSEKLNERYYGKIQGLNKKETIEKFGEDKVRLWRRSYSIAPPGGESLKAVCARITPFYRKYVASDLQNGKNVLVVASHNPLRALAKHIENISDNEIINFEIPYGGLIEYNLDEKLKLINKSTL